MVASLYVSKEACIRRARNVMEINILVLAGIAILLLFLLLLNSLLVIAVIITAYYLHKYIKQFHDVMSAFEQAFACELLGDNPHINIFDWPINDKIWMVPCRDKARQDIQLP